MVRLSMIATCVPLTGLTQKQFDILLETFTLIFETLREINASFEGLKVSEHIPLRDDPSITVDCKTLRTNLKAGAKKAYPVYPVIKLLNTVDEEKMLKLLENAPAGIEDKDSLMSVIKKHVKVEPNFFGLGGDVKGLVEELWLRYRARRG